MIRPGSQNARLLAVLSDGEWHTSRELHERCGYMRTNSRVAELRSHGHDIQGESVPGKTGTDGYRYRLLADQLPRVVPPPVDTPAAAPPVTDTPCARAGLQLDLFGAAA